MAKSTVPNKTLINPVFSIPAGAEEQFVRTDETVFPSDEAPVELDEFGAAEEVFEEGEGGEDFEALDDYDQLDTPTEFFVFAQTLRRAPGGQQVVDVIIESEDVAGAVNYEFNVVKV